MELVQIEAEAFTDIAKALEVPDKAFLVFDEDNPDVWLFYKEAA